MFEIDYSDMKIKMHRGDTGAFFIGAEKDSGAAWGVHDRMVFTVVNGSGETMMKRYYRLDSGRTSVDLPDGVALIELHNGDTDQWPNGTYNTELRFVTDAVWDGSEETDDMVDATVSAGQIQDGIPVSTEIQSTLELREIYGEV